MKVAVATKNTINWLVLMLFIIGFVIVFGGVAAGYAMHGGNFGVLWQPSEIVIIFGAAIGAFIISNPPSAIKGVLSGLKNPLKGDPFNKADYKDLLLFLFNICKLMKTKGMLEVEPALDDPHSSELFTNYPKFMHNHHGVEFFCDYMRLVTMGMDNHYQLEDLMDKELEAHHHHGQSAAMSMNNFADGLPALGIVAAVLGVIMTMGSIAEPPEILGGLIGAALVGTFMGILMGYGFFGPIAANMGKYADADAEYYAVLKTAILAHVQGNAPVVTVEFARKIIPHHLRPSFQELDALVNGPAPAE